MTFDELAAWTQPCCDQPQMSRDQAAELSATAKRAGSILIFGGTGSGRSSLAAALARSVDGATVVDELRHPADAALLPAQSTKPGLVIATIWGRTAEEALSRLSLLTAAHEDAPMTFDAIYEVTRQRHHRQVTAHRGAGDSSALNCQPAAADPAGHVG